MKSDNLRTNEVVARSKDGRQGEGVQALVCNEGLYGPSLVRALVA